MNESQMLQQAKQALTAGDRATGQRLLLQVIKQNPRSEVAWLWLSAIVNDPAKERDCLERVLRINPSNEPAQRHLASLGQARTAPRVQPQALQDHSRALAIDQRTAILDRQIAQYVNRGFRLQSRTDTTAHLVKPKKFSFLLAALGLLFWGIGLLLYLLYYWSKKDQSVFIQVDPQGRLVDSSAKTVLPQQTPEKQPSKKAIPAIGWLLIGCVAIFGLATCYVALFETGESSHSSKERVPTESPTYPPTWTPAAQDAPSRREVLNQVRELLSDSYNVTGFDDVVAETGGHGLFVSIQGSQSNAESLLKEITVMASPYTIVADPPFDVAIVMIYSSTGDEILGTAVMREHVEAWLNGSISADSFVSKWILITP